MFDRRALLTAISSTALVGPVHAQGSGLSLGPDRLVLLGNKGGPSIRFYAPSPSSSLIVWKGVPYVIDAGYGATFKLVEAGFPLGALRTIFITHNHSDHNLEAGILPYNAWAISLKTPVDVYGPPGIEGVVKGAMDANNFDIETRIADEGKPRSAQAGHSTSDRRRRGDAQCRCDR